jgi:hypothetical protein
LVTGFVHMIHTTMPRPVGICGVATDARGIAGR